MASAEAMAASLQYQKEHISDTKVPMIMASVIAWFVIAYTAVAMRLISRRLSRTLLKWDDWCILSSLVSIPSLTTYWTITESFEDIHHYIRCSRTGVGQGRIWKTCDSREEFEAVHAGEAH